jgi:hypothetical protein
VWRPTKLAAAHKRIAQLGAELALTRDACELFNGRHSPTKATGKTHRCPLSAKARSHRNAHKITNQMARAKNQTSLTGSIIPADFSSTRGTQTMAR